MSTRKVNIGDGSTIDVTVSETPDGHTITVDGVSWVTTENRVHAAVLYNMIADHITEYVTYEPRG